MAEESDSKILSSVLSPFSKGLMREGLVCDWDIEEVVVAEPKSLACGKRGRGKALPKLRRSSSSLHAGSVAFDVFGVRVELPLVGLWCGLRRAFGVEAFRQAFGIP